MNRFSSVTSRASRALLMNTSFLPGVYTASATRFRTPAHTSLAGASQSLRPLTKECQREYLAILLCEAIEIVNL